MIKETPQAYTHTTSHNFVSEIIKKSINAATAGNQWAQNLNIFMSFLAHSIWDNGRTFKKNWYRTAVVSTLYDVSASEYDDKHKDDISFTIRTLLFHFNEHDVAHESRIVVVVVVVVYT